MTSENKGFNIAVALATDGIDAKRALEEVFSNYGEKVKSVNWCLERTESGEETEWTEYFNTESPVPLIEQMGRKYEPDLIICGFWKLFGSNFRQESDLNENQLIGSYKSFFDAWVKTGNPPIKILFSDKEKRARQIEERERLFVQYFRKALYDKNENLWFSYKTNSTLQKIVSKELAAIIERNAELTSFAELPEPLRLDLPSGWLYLNKYLKDNYQDFDKEIGKEDLQDFFDGKRPSLGIAVSDSVPRRLAVGQLKEQINEAAKNGRHRVTLLRGPGGEGKSTSLLQLAIDLVKQREPICHVIIQRKGAPSFQNPLRSITEYLLKFQPVSKRSKFTFVIVLDDAHLIADKVFECADVLNWEYNAPNKIQFILASQGTEWQWRKVPDDYMWRREFGENNFVVRDVKRLEPNDAKEIVQAWEQADALGELQKIANEEERWKLFYDSATDRVTKDENSNSFYGAMLDVRKNKTLEGYVEDILGRLRERISFNGKSLKFYFAYIVALHADGFPLLRKSILQKAWRCTEEQLIDEILNPLEDEKVTWGADELIFARHDVVAATAKYFYEKESATYFHRVIADLAVAAEHIHAEAPAETPDIGAWRTMPKVYFEELNQKNLAISIAEKVARELRTDPVAIGLWANLLRKDRRKEEAAQIFSDLYDEETCDKGYFTEWGVSQRNLRNYCVSVWLTAIALSDYTTERNDRLEPPLLRISSLALAFGELFTQNSNSRAGEKSARDRSDIFKKAVKGAVNLGRSSQAETNAKPSYNFRRSDRNLDGALRKVGETEISGIDIKTSLDFVMQGIDLAWELRENDRAELPVSLPEPSRLTFNELKTVFGIKPIMPGTTSHIQQTASQDGQKQTAYKANKFPFFYDRDAKKVCDAEGLAVDLSDALVDVLLLFFEKDGQSIRNKLTFAEIAQEYKKKLDDEDDEIAVARNFQRNLHDQLEKNYGLKRPEDIVKPWRENGYQLGSNWDFSKTRRYIDALERPTFPITEE